MITSSYFTRRGALAVMLLGALAACGDDDGDDAFVSGTWRGTATLVQNTCENVTPDPSLTFAHVVNQNEESVIMQEGSVQYVGNVVGDNGFSVDAAGIQTVGSGGEGCGFSQRVEYDGIDDDADSIDDVGEDSDEDDNPNTADVRITAMGTCPGASSCEVVYEGRATRDQLLQGVSSSDSSGSSSSIADRGDCLELDSRSFSGDGGCGIGTTTLTESNGVLTLNPVASNGSVNFTPSVADSTQAGSADSNLNLVGGSGFSCTMECRPPNTFDLVCVDDNGGSCTERF